MTIKVELGAEIVSRTFHTKQRQSPAMTDETNAQDLKALELEHLRAVEATLDEIAREIAEMKAEAQRCGACILNSPLSG